MLSTLDGALHITQTKVCGNMILRKYSVDNKEVIVNVEVFTTDRPMIAFTVQAEPDVLKQYIEDNTLTIAFDLDDILDAVREALSPKKVVRD